MVERSIGTDRNALPAATRTKTFPFGRFGGDVPTPDTMGTVSTTIDNAFAVRRPRGCFRGLEMLVPGVL